MQNMKSAGYGRKELLLLLFFFVLATIAMEEVCESPDIEYLSTDLPIVVLDYNDLKNQIDLTQPIQTAFGPSGLGILLVKNAPNLRHHRLRLLTLAPKFANLDEQTKHLKPQNFKLDFF